MHVFVLGINFSQLFLAKRVLVEWFHTAPPGVSYKSPMDHTQITTAVGWIEEAAQLLPFHVMWCDTMHVPHGHIGGAGTDSWSFPIILQQISSWIKQVQ